LLGLLRLLGLLGFLRWLLLLGRRLRLARLLRGGRLGRRLLASPTHAALSGGLLLGPAAQLVGELRVPLGDLVQALPQLAVSSVPPTRGVVKREPGLQQPNTQVSHTPIDRFLPRSLYCETRLAPPNKVALRTIQSEHLRGIEQTLDWNLS